MSYLGKQPAFAPLVSADITNALGFTPIQLTSLSATQNLSYNSTTGQFTGPDLSGYLTSATAASTYLTQSNAASTYQTQSGMSSYLTTASASSTYLTQANAASTYQTQSGMSSYLTTSAASSTYFPLAGGTVVGTARVQAAAAQDAVIVAGRAGGTSSYAVTVTPTTLTANQTITLPDNSGTVLTTGATVTVAQGGTNSTATPTAGAVAYGNGTGYAFTAAGTAGQVLTSNGSGAPYWAAAAGGGGGISTGKSVAMSMIFGF